MTKLFINNTLAKTFIASLLLLSSALQASGKSPMIDLEQEIIIKAKRQTADLKNKIATYIDNVVISQGTLNITADSVKVYIAEDESETYIAKGKPAIFEQTLSDGETVLLEANTIIYQPSQQTLTISGNALLRQAGSEVKGSKITYNILTEQLEAESNPDEEVTTILQPKKKAAP
jgi:lipopolysaccharide export system protein LptA